MNGHTPAVLKGLILNTKTRAVLLMVAMLAIATPPLGAQEFETVSSAELASILEDSGMNWRKVSDGVFTASEGNGSWAATTTGDEIGFARDAALTPSIEDLANWNAETDIPEATTSFEGRLTLEHFMKAKGATETSILETFEWFKGEAEKAIDYFENRGPTS